MPDNTRRRDGRDRSKVAANQPYELYYFRKKHDITVEQARKIIREAGNNREKANAAAERLKRR